MKFTLRAEDSDGSTIETVFEEVSHIEVLEHMQSFLAGCGYRFSLDQELVLWDNSLEPAKNLGE